MTVAVGSKKPLILQIPQLAQLAHLGLFFSFQPDLLPRFFVLC
jgi:hypothetical protein